MEEYELADWDIKFDTDNVIREEKAVGAYFLHEWYEKIKDLTFPTYFFSIENSNKTFEPLPDKLPFDKSMVRTERRSPKDSKHWGPVSTKEEVLQLFATSLRCRDANEVSFHKIGNIYCVREWASNIECEYRTFYNETFKAVVSGNDNIEPNCKAISDYLLSIVDRIPYYRCVLDIAQIRNKDGTVEYKIIEFNSWEVNSGAYGLDWYENTEVFYNKDTDILFKWGKNTELMSIQQLPKHILCLGNRILFKDFPTLEFEIVCPSVDSNWILSGNNLYVANEIWLYRFDLTYKDTFKAISWVRGNFRFSFLSLCKDGSINAGNKNYSMDLSKVKEKINPKLQIICKKEYSIFSYRYGFVGVREGKYVFFRLMSDDTLIMVHTVT